MRLQYSPETFRLLYKSLKELLPDWEHNAREQGTSGPLFTPWRQRMRERAKKALAKAEGK